MEQKVTVLIVTWNAMRYIDECLKSVLAQDFTDYKIMVIDNNSSDETVNHIRREYPTVSLLKNFNNQGFSRAYNQGIQLAHSEYVLVMNHDVILTPHYLSTIVSFADQHPSGAGFGGKLLKLSSQSGGGEELGIESIKLDILDECGLQIMKSRWTINRGEGQKDTGQFDRAEEVFGSSGACVLYRRSALEEVAVKNEYFDNDFFAYKEDIDLAWRFRMYGFENWYCPDAVGYHHRRLAALMQSHVGGIRKVRSGVPKKLRMISLRNHHLMIYKNDFPSNFWRHAHRIFAREVLMIGYIILFEPFQIKALWEFVAMIPQMRQKRKIIFGHRAVKPSDIRKWFV